MFKLYKLIAALFMIFLLSACHFLPNKPEVFSSVTPKLELPAAVEEKATTIDWLSWWKGFEDSVLDALLQEATTQNLDLSIATARIAEARAALDQNKANYYPSIDFTAGANRRGASENAASSRSGAALSTSDLQYGITVSYELDFWGRLAQADDIARARLLAQTANRRIVLVTLYANVAQAYFNLRAFDAQVLLMQQTLDTRQANLKLQERRLLGGVVGELDVQQARSEVAAVEATLLTIKQNLKNTESTLALLLGRKPAAIFLPDVNRGKTMAVLYESPIIPTGLPSDILTRRPDIAAAEQNLRANSAELALARTAYYPRISLSAGLGQQSSELSNLFSGSSIFWNMLGNLAQPIFRAGAIDAAVAASTARQTQAVLQYTQVVQTAFKETHDSMNSIGANRAIVQVLAKRIVALKASLRLADVRYKGGYSNYLEVLNAQRDLAQAEIALIDAQRAQLNALVGFYKAVGGGWDSRS
jgi:outer membrane protein, multidrug efflux system